MWKMAIGLVTLIIWVITGVSLIVNIVSMSSVDSWLVRAKDAGNPAQVAEFLTDYKTALDEADLIEGKYTSFWKYPGTKMTIYIRAIDGLIERAEALSIQKADDTSYQMGLVNLEKDLGDIETAAVPVFMAYIGILLVWLCTVSLLVSAAIGIAIKENIL